MFSSFGGRRRGGVSGSTWEAMWKELRVISFIFISQLPGHSVPFSRCWQLEIRWTAIHFGKLLIFPNWGSVVWLGGGENVPRSWVSCASSRFIIVSTWGPMLNASLTFGTAPHRPARLPSSHSSSWVTHLLEFQSCQKLEVYEVLSAEFTAAYSMKNITYANFTKEPLGKRKELSRSGTPQGPL